MIIVNLAENLYKKINKDQELVKNVRISVMLKELLKLYDSMFLSDNIKEEIASNINWLTQTGAKTPVNKLYNNETLKYLKETLPNLIKGYKENYKISKII